MCAERCVRGRRQIAGGEHGHGVRFATTGGRRLQLLEGEGHVNRVQQALRRDERGDLVRRRVLAAGTPRRRADLDPLARRPRQAP